MRVDDSTDTCSVSNRSIRRYIHRFKQTGKVKAAVHQHGPPKVFGNYEQPRMILGFTCKRFSASYLQLLIKL